MLHCILRALLPPISSHFSLALKATQITFPLLVWLWSLPIVFSAGSFIYLRCQLYGTSSLLPFPRPRFFSGFWTPESMAGTSQFFIFFPFRRILVAILIGGNFSPNPKKAPHIFFNPVRLQVSLSLVHTNSTLVFFLLGPFMAQHPRGRECPCHQVKPVFSALLSQGPPRSPFPSNL